MRSTRIRHLTAFALVGVLLMALTVHEIGGDDRPAGAATSTLTPTADVAVSAASPTTRFGGRTQFTVDGSPQIQSFLRFDLATVVGTVSSAKLRLHVDNANGAQSPAGGTVASSTNTTWSESTTTWNTRPAIDGTPIGSFAAVARNTWVEVDVTQFVTAHPGTTVTFAMSSTNADNADYDSRETGSTAPQLVVTITDPITTTSSTTTTTTTTTTPPITGITIAALGDAVCAPGSTVSSTTCRHQAVSNQLAANPAISTVLMLGDLQYENGELTNFQTAYDPSYGQLKARTKPAPGNHEYNTAGATGYYTYFGALAGDPSKGYYSFDIGTKWHVVALNSNCSAVACAAGSTQEQWLRADLAASARPCTIAYWHHPRFSSGQHGDDTVTTALWNALTAAGAELVLNGHDHDYERFAPQTSGGVASTSGLREFVVGTGGKNQTAFATIRANSEQRLNAFGYLELVLGDGTYSWKFTAEGGATLDSGTGTCH